MTATTAPAPRYLTFNPTTRKYVAVTLPARLPVGTVVIKLYPTRDGALVTIPGASTFVIAANGTLTQSDL